MEELSEDFERLVKISAIKKLNKINQNYLCKGVTIGPEAHKSPSPARTKSKSEKNKLKKEEIREQINSNGTSPISEYAIIKEVCNIKRQEERDKALKTRIKEFEKFDKQLEKERQNQWLRSQQAFINDMEKQEMNIAEANQRIDQKNSTQQAKLVQEYQDAALRMKQKRDALKAKERQRELLRQSIEKVKRNQSQFTSEYEQIFVILKSCRDNANLRDLIGQDTELLKTLPEEMEILVASCKTSTISEKEVNKSLEILNKIINLKNRFKRSVEEINKKIADAENAKKEELETSNSSQNDCYLQNKSDATINQTHQPIQPQENISQSSVTPDVHQNIKIEKFVSMANLKTYTNVLEFHENFKQSFSQLEQDVSMKQFKFDCKKAVNISVNALSGANAEHILDKYRKLHRLLSGQSIIVSDKEVNASRHPQGIAFCMDLLAKKFVLQGDLMVSNKPEYAFCYASLIITLWNDFPGFGNVVLAYFYKSCPYLVPYKIPKQVGDTDEEYYTKLGYQYTDGQIENHDKFLKRMTGIIRLYAAILISKPKRGQNTHPHNLKNGWRWLASFLKLEPQIDITATALHTFLEAVGFDLDLKYGLMFKKLIRIVVTVFLDKCRKAKSVDGPITRLESLLSDYLKNQKFQKPEGYIDYAYW